MSGGGKNDAPEPPDPQVTANAQTGMNIDTALANQILGMTNQNTPYGNLHYTQRKNPFEMTIGGQTYEIPRFKATTNMSPRQEQLYRTQTGAQQNLAELARDQSKRLGSLLGKPMDLSGAPAVNAPNFNDVNLRDDFGKGGKIQRKLGDAGDITESYGTGWSKDRGRVEEALMSRLNPSLDRDREALTSSLANKGIKPGSEAYDRAMDELDRTATDARMQAILAGGDEQSRLAGLARDRATFENSAQGQQFGQNLASGQFGNQAQAQQFGQNQARAGFQNTSRLGEAGFNNQWGQQGFANDRALRGDYLSEQYAARNQPINEIGALLGTGQVQNPNFVNTPGAQAATTDIAGITANNYNQQMQAWQQQQQNSQGLLGGLFGLGSSAILGWPFG